MAMFSSELEIESLSAVMTASRLTLAAQCLAPSSRTERSRAPPGSIPATTLCGPICCHGEVPGSTLFGKPLQNPVGRSGSVTAEAAKNTLTATFDGGVDPAVVDLHEDPHGAVSLSVLVSQSGGEDSVIVFEELEVDVRCRLAFETSASIDLDVLALPPERLRAEGERIRTRRTGDGEHAARVDRAVAQVDLHTRHGGLIDGDLPDAAALCGRAQQA